MNEIETAWLVEGLQGTGQDRVVLHTDGVGTTVVLADGASGTAGGSMASERAAAIASEGLAGSDGGGAFALLATVDRALNMDRNAGETTLVALRLVGDHVVGASIGDSGAWLVERDMYTAVTDQQHRKPLLGSGAAYPVEFRSTLGTATLLVASDGLLNYVRPPAICDAINSGRSLPEIARQLVDLARNASGGLHDDVGIALARRRRSG